MNTATRGRELLTVDAVEKIYRRGPELVRALKTISLSLLQGEVVCITGPSGSGKTTLLNICAGWEVPDAGIVTWTESPDTSPDNLAWDALAIVPQDLGLTEELTIRENVELPWIISRPHDARLAQRADRLMRSLHLDGLANRLPFETSRGQQQRAAIARALILEPRLLLADEPSAHQDEASAAAIFQALRAAAVQGTCCAVATNDPAMARYADRKVSLLDGSIGDADS
jgi:ABC-type lipoprotein export system ATPase subunit